MQIIFSSIQQRLLLSFLFSLSLPIVEASNNNLLWEFFSFAPLLQHFVNICMGNVHTHTHTLQGKMTKDIDAIFQMGISFTHTILHIMYFLFLIESHNVAAMNLFELLLKISLFLLEEQRGKLRNKGGDKLLGPENWLSLEKIQVSFFYGISYCYLMFKWGDQGDGFKNILLSKRVEKKIHGLKINNFLKYLAFNIVILWWS